MIVKNINKHKVSESILADCQYRFHTWRPFEAQLVQFVQDLASDLDSALNHGHTQTDVIIMDFSKDFFNVPHSRRLLYRLEYYGIRRTTHKWISSFLSGCSQGVVLDSQASDTIRVLSEDPKDQTLKRPLSPVSPDTHR